MEFYGKILTCARLDFYTIQCSDVYVFILYLYNWVTYAYFISILLIGIYRLYLYYKELLVPVSKISSYKKWNCVVPKKKFC
jgi:hypothetical protein